MINSGGANFTLAPPKNDPTPEMNDPLSISCVVNDPSKNSNDPPKQSQKNTVRTLKRQPPHNACRRKIRLIWTALDLKGMIHKKIRMIHC